MERPNGCLHIDCKINRSKWKVVCSELWDIQLSSSAQICVLTRPSQQRYCAELDFKPQQLRLKRNQRYSICMHFFLLHRFQRWQSFRAENIYTSEVCLLCPAWSGSLAMISDDKMTATHFWHLDTFCIIWILRQNGAVVWCLNKCKEKVVPWYPAVSSTTEALAADAIVLSYATYIIKW